MIVKFPSGNQYRVREARTEASSCSLCRESRWTLLLLSGELKRMRKARAVTISEIAHKNLQAGRESSDKRQDVEGFT